MPYPPLPGPVVLCGDSITVGLASYVTAAPDPTAKITLAVGGQTSTALLAQVRKAEADGVLDGPKTATVLIGTNDIGGNLTPEQSLANISTIYSILAFHGINVIAMTVPPFKGYAGYASRYDAINAKRNAINAGILASRVPAKLLDLGQFVGSTNDPEKLSPGFDGGDHLHLRKDALGALILSGVAGLGAPAALPALVPDAAFPWVTTSIVGSLGAAIGWMLWKRHTKR